MSVENENPIEELPTGEMEEETSGFLEEENSGTVKKIVHFEWKIGQFSEKMWFLSKIFLKT